MYGDVNPYQELPDTVVIVTRGIVVGKQPLFVLRQLSSFLAHKEIHMPQDLFVDLVCDKNTM